MSKTMLYRLAGGYEPEIGSIRVEGIDLQFKTFDEAALEGARGRGWVRINQILDAKASVDAESTDQVDSGAITQSATDTASAETGAENAGDEQAAAAFPTDSKANLVAWIREQDLAKQFDLRKSLADLVADVSAHMSAANG